MEFIPYGRQFISGADIQSVVDVLQSDCLTQGPLVDKFEENLASYVKAEYAVMVANATAALHLSCLALGVSEGDIVWTSPNSFVASSNCALYCGAEVDFVDIDPDTYNMSVEQLEQKLKLAKVKGRLPKIVIPVHFAGQSCDMVAIKALSDQYSFKIIEDASHAIGAKYSDEPVGCCKYSDIAIFSFHPVKIITTGEGGAAITNDEEIAIKIADLRTHGITRDKSRLTDQSQGAWYYEQQSLGFNYRITDIQCALGLSQLSRIDSFLEQRSKLASCYNMRLSNSSYKKPTIDNDCKSSWHLYPLQLKSADRKYVFEKLREANIGVNVHYIPIHLQPYYTKLGFKAGDFPIAESYYDKVISLPLQPQMTEEHIDYVCDQLNKCVNEMSMAV